MSWVILIASCLFVLIQNTYAMEDLRGTKMQECINCLCHARSGCWNRLNCARYSISKDYWKIAGSPSVGYLPDSDSAYKRCMHNENCILNTVKGYTEYFGELDCNCDGVFDCKDRFAIHLHGENCTNPTFGEIYSSWFNECADEIGVSRMSLVEGDCEPERFTNN